MVKPGLSVFTLWALTVYLTKKKKAYYLLTFIPALFMTAVCVTYICVAPEGLGLSESVSYIIGGVCVAVSVVWYAIWRKRKNRKERQENAMIAKLNS